MLLETFYGSDLRRVLDEARRTFGEDVLVVHSHVQRDGARTRVEVVAGAAEGMALLYRRLNPPAPSLPRRDGGRGLSGPVVIAFVGPAGAGKTTSLVKLAMHKQALPGATIGLLSLDTYRVGAVDQLQQYAEIAGVPLEVAYDEKEIPGALRRLDHCEAILVDTPGRSPRLQEAYAQCRDMLRAVAPDETHLVIPATMRGDAVALMLAQYAEFKLTHLLLTRFDEIAGDGSLAETVARTDLPMRWVSDGQSVPDDLHPARTRVLTALGIPPRASQASVAA